MDTKRILEVGTSWCCGVALGALYVANEAYPTLEVVTTGTEPAWVNTVTTLVTVMVGVMALGVIGLAYHAIIDDRTQRTNGP